MAGVKRGRGNLDQEERKGSPPPSPLARGLAPFFPFERLPRRLLFSLNFRRLLRECLEPFLLQSRPQRPRCRWPKGSRRLETYISFRLKFRLTPQLICFLFYMDGCIPGAISENTYVTFVDEIWSKWNWKLKEGKNPTGLIRVDCCLLVSLVQVQLFCEGKCNWLLYWLALQIWFPRRLFRRDKSSELSRLLGNL